MKNPEAVLVDGAQGLPLAEFMKIVLAEGVYPITFTLDMCKTIGFAMQEFPDEHRRRAIIKLCNSVGSIRGCSFTSQEMRMIDAFIEGWCATDSEAGLSS